MMLTLGLIVSDVWAQTLEGEKDSLFEARMDSIGLEAELRDLAVTAQRSLVANDIDRIAYDVSGDKESKVLTVLDMLRKVPYITVDGNDNIKVKGSSAFKIYKNGHFDSSLSRNAKEVLKAMPASMLKRVEVITEPGAREDAEGVDAILNLVFEEGNKMDGVTGSLSGSYNTQFHPNANANAYLMTQLGKLTASVDYGYGGMSRRETETKVNGWTAYTKTGNYLKTTDEHQSPGFVHFADVNLSLELDTMNLFSASLGGYFFNLNVEGDSRTQMTHAQGSPLYGYKSHFWMPDYLHHSWQGRMDYEHHTHRKDERWTVSYMLAFTRQHVKNEETYEPDLELTDAALPFGYTGFLSDGRERFSEHTLQLDWLRPLGKGHQLETGAKYIYRRNHSHNHQDFYDIAESDTETRFRHRTHVSALYADYIYRCQRWSARAGLRYELSAFSFGEYESAEGDDLKVLNDLVPQISLKWQVTDRQSLKLGYTTSIRRPGIEYLNPAIERSPLSVSQGNAHLKSNRMQNLHVIYMYMGQRITLNLAPAVKWSNNGIGLLQTSHGDVKYTTYGNIINHRRLQFEGYMQWKPLRMTTLVINANAGHDKYENPALGLGLSRWSAFFYGYVMQDLWWKLKFTLAGYGQVGKEISDVYGYSEPWGAGSVSLQRSFLPDDRLTVRLGANIPFREFKGYTSHTIQGDFTQYNHRLQRSRMFSLSVSFRFGGLKANVRKTETSIENDDIVGGITKSR